MQDYFIKYFEKTSDEALKSLAAGKRYQFKKMFTNKSFEQVVRSHYEGINNSQAARTMIDNYIKDIKNMSNFTQQRYNTVLNIVKNTPNEAVRERILINYARSGVSAFESNNGAVWGLETYTANITTQFNNEFMRSTVIENAKEGSLFRVGFTRNPCDLCIPWQGKTLTLNEYEKAKNSGLGHYNCGHYITEVQQ